MSRHPSEGWNGEHGISPNAQNVFGTFTVCPFTSSKPGVMQFVCVDSVRDTRVRARP